MALLQGEYIVSECAQEHAAIDLGLLAKDYLLRGVPEALKERDDLFEVEDSYMGTVYRFRAHVFSETELAEYKNRIIAEFLELTGTFTATIPTPTKEESDQ